MAVYKGTEPTNWVICHYGVKGMKWGKRKTPSDYSIKTEIEKWEDKSGKEHERITSTNPKTGKKKITIDGEEFKGIKKYKNRPSARQRNLTQKPLSNRIKEAVRISKPLKRRGEVREITGGSIQGDKQVINSRPSYANGREHTNKMGKVIQNIKDSDVQIENTSTKKRRRKTK